MHFSSPSQQILQQLYFNNAHIHAHVHIRTHMHIKAHPSTSTLRERNVDCASVLFLLLLCYLNVAVIVLSCLHLLGRIESSWIKLEVKKLV